MAVAAHIEAQAAPDIDILSIRHPIRQNELHQWRADIAFRNRDEFKAWATGAGDIEGLDQIVGCLRQSVLALPSDLRLAWQVS